MIDGLANGLDRAAGGLDTWLGSHRRLYLILAAGLCLLTFTGYSHARVPWVDEVLQMTIERLPTVSKVMAALSEGTQVDPPLQHVLVHSLFRVFGEHVFLARLPSILGFCLMCVSLSLLVWRHAPPLYAAAAFFVPMSTVLRGRAMDARPYGLMLGFSALTLLCWDGMENSQRRTLWRIGFTFSLAVALSTHFYSILLLLPLGLGELAKWVFRKRPDWVTFLCIGVALIPYGFWLPTLLSASRRFTPHFYYKVAFNNLYDFYGFLTATLPMAAVLLFLMVAMALAGRVRVDATPWTSLSDRYRALLLVAVGFLLTPVAGYVAGVLVTTVFIPYHFIIAAFGLILGIPLLLPAITGRSQVAGLCLLLTIGGHGMFVTMRGLSGFLRRDAGYPSVAEMRKLIPEPTPDIIVPSPFHFLPFHEANRFDPVNSLVYLYDPEKAFQEVGTDTADLVAESLRPITEARIEPFDSYVATHKHFYMAVLGEVNGVQEWQFQYLLKHVHASFWWLGRVGSFDLFRVDLG